MRSDKQIEASRQNGKKSRGPVTNIGRQNSAGNRLTHGMYARSIRLEGESRKRFNALITRLYSEFQPQTPCEEILVEKMITAQWRQFRLWCMERSMMTQESDKRFESRCCDQPVDCDALSFRAVTAAGFHQQEMRLDRQFTRALDRLMKLKSAVRPQEMPANVEESEK